MNGILHPTGRTKLGGVMFVEKQRDQVLSAYLSCLDVYIPLSQELPDNSHVLFCLCRSQGSDHHSSVASFVLMIHVADTYKGRNECWNSRAGDRLGFNSSTEHCLLARTHGLCFHSKVTALHS